MAKAYLHSRNFGETEKEINDDLHRMTYPPNAASLRQDARDDCISWKTFDTIEDTQGEKKWPDSHSRIVPLKRLEEKQLQ